MASVVHVGTIVVVATGNRWSSLVCGGMSAPVDVFYDVWVLDVIALCVARIDAPVMTRMVVTTAFGALVTADVERAHPWSCERSRTERRPDDSSPELMCTKARMTPTARIRIEEAQVNRR